MRHALVALLLLPVPVTAQAAAAPPDDVEFTIRTAGGQSTFRIGEAIPIELCFRASSEGKYRLTQPWGIVRNGAMARESVETEPSSGADDPLDLWERSRSEVFALVRGSGISLSSEMRTVPMELNFWVRFQKPGEYHVTITSTHITRIGDRTPLSLRSNGLALTLVTPTPEWQQRTLKQALEAFDSSSESPGQRGGAARRIAYLGTPAAARAMVVRFNDRNLLNQDIFTKGLAATPARDAAFEEMRTRLEDPQFPVTRRFLQVMAFLQLNAGPGNRVEECGALETRLVADLAAVLYRKQGPALSISAETILDHPLADPKNLPLPARRALTDQLAANIESLSPGRQGHMLAYRWHLLDHERIVPALRRLAVGDAPASGVVLERLYQVAPEEGRSVILEEIRRPEPRFDVSVLGLLPDKELPDAGAMLMEHLETARSVEARGRIASLIHRYASGLERPAIVGYLDQHEELPDAVRVPLLAYLVRVDPNEARLRLDRARSDVRLSAVGHFEANPMLEELALDALHAGTPWMVDDAAYYLRDHGSASAETALWQALTIWRGRSSSGDPVDTLVNSLARGQGWLLGAAGLRRIADLAKGTPSEAITAAWLANWSRLPQKIACYPTPSSASISIGFYTDLTRTAALDKLAQFPQGTEFVWETPLERPEEAKLFEELTRAAAARGLVITTKP